MATYRVTGPDGKVYNVEGPDDATDEELIRRVQAESRFREGEQAMRGFAEHPVKSILGGTLERILGTVGGAGAGTAAKLALPAGLRGAGLLPAMGRIAGGEIPALARGDYERAAMGGAASVVPEIGTSLLFRLLSGRSGKRPPTRATEADLLRTAEVQPNKIVLGSKYGPVSQPAPTPPSPTSVTFPGVAPGGTPKTVELPSTGGTAHLKTVFPPEPARHNIPAELAKQTLTTAASAGAHEYPEETIAGTMAAGEAAQSGLGGILGSILRGIGFHAGSSMAR